MNLRQKIGAALFLLSGSIVGAGTITIIGVGLVQSVPLAMQGDWMASAYVCVVVVGVTFVVGLFLVRDV